MLNKTEIIINLRQFASWQRLINAPLDLLLILCKITIMQIIILTYQNYKRGRL
jgi:hypothetical protein